MRKRTVFILLSVFFTGCVALAAGVHIGEQSTMDAAPAEGDKLPIYDVSASTGYAITALNLLGALEAALTDFEIHADNLGDIDPDKLAGDGTDNNLVDQDIMETIARSEFIPITAMVADGTADPGAEAETDCATYREFVGDGNTNGMEFMWQVPGDLTGTTVKARVVCIITNATTPADGEGVHFSISGCSAGTNDDHDCIPAGGGNSIDEDLDDDAGAQWDVVYFPYTTVTPSDLAAGEIVHFLVQRNSSLSADDYERPIGVLGVEIKWQEDPGAMTF